MSIHSASAAQARAAPEEKFPQEKEHIPQYIKDHPSTSDLRYVIEFQKKFFPNLIEQSDALIEDLAKRMNDLNKNPLARYKKVTIGLRHFGVDRFNYAREFLYLLTLERNFLTAILELAKTRHVCTQMDNKILQRYKGGVVQQKGNLKQAHLFHIPSPKSVEAFTLWLKYLKLKPLGLGNKIEAIDITGKELKKYLESKNEEVRNLTEDIIIFREAKRLNNKSRIENVSCQEIIQRVDVVFEKFKVQHLVREFMPALALSSCFIYPDVQQRLGVNTGFSLQQMTVIFKKMGDLFFANKPTIRLYQSIYNGLQKDIPEKNEDERAIKVLFFQNIEKPDEYINNFPSSEIKKPKKKKKSGKSKKKVKQDTNEPQLQQMLPAAAAAAAAAQPVQNPVAAAAAQQNQQQGVLEIDRVIPAQREKPWEGKGRFYSNEERVNRWFRLMRGARKEPFEIPFHEYAANKHNIKALFRHAFPRIVDNLLMDKNYCQRSEELIANKKRIHFQFVAQFTYGDQTIERGVITYSMELGKKNICFHRYFSPYNDNDLNVMDISELFSNVQYRKPNEDDVSEKEDDFQDVGNFSIELDETYGNITVTDKQNNLVINIFKLA